MHDSRLSSRGSHLISQGSLLGTAAWLVHCVLTLTQRGMQHLPTCSETMSTVHYVPCRCRELEERLAALQLRQAACTPRPAKDLGPMADLLTPQECLLLERALISGCSPETLHRLLLGVTADGVNMLPWLQLVGAGRAAMHVAAQGEGLLLALGVLPAGFVPPCDAVSGIEWQ